MSEGNLYTWLYSLITEIEALSLQQKVFAVWALG